MPESDLSGSSFLVLAANPLPWTEGGPNEGSKRQQPTASHIINSVADPIFTIKNRVVTMKELEALKKRLPPGIDIRITSKNVLKYRARFRKTGLQDVIRTFPDLKLAKQWLAGQERNALLGDFLPPMNRGKKHTFSHAVKRYKEEELPKKGEDARNREQHLDWFEKHLGKISFCSIRPSHIKDVLLILENEESSKRKKRLQQLL